jgi:hypothetical protein
MAATAALENNQIITHVLVGIAEARIRALTNRIILFSPRFVPVHEAAQLFLP